MRILLRIGEGKPVPKIAQNPFVAERRRQILCVRQTPFPQHTVHSYPSPVHRCIHAVVHLIADHADRLHIPARFCATKLIEGDDALAERLGLDQNERELLEHCIVQMETESGLDRNAALADMRYQFIESVVKDSVVKCRESR